jgi:anthranilate synthase component 1
MEKLKVQSSLFQLHTRSRKMLADTHTPVSIYLKLRDKYRNPVLLESSDYHGTENSFSYICCEPIAEFRVQGRSIHTLFPDGDKNEQAIKQKGDVTAALAAFAANFKEEVSDLKFVSNGLFGYMAYDAVQFYEDLDLQENPDAIPHILYQVYRYVIVVDHFRNELHAFEHGVDKTAESGLQQLIATIHNKNFPSYQFSRAGEESSNFNDEDFLQVLQKGVDHCNRGDVFQIVLSRRFQTSFSGDEFNVYRALRSINPSPYLFYFDYGSFKIFGSSPEAQIVLKGNKASIYPIAGTFRRTGNDAKDAELAQELYDDPKENAEHVMLVDLARNDLSRHGQEVEVKTFKEIQYYSHVIHLVSHVQGTLAEGQNPVQIVADTFPAGTLSGAPKHSAMQLINRYEASARGYYGGAIGFMSFNGEDQPPQFNHAIMIRSFLSRNNTLYYQAGAGVVAKSSIQSELQEVHNKLAALRQAIRLAEEIE